ncbi:MAG: alanine racemase [Clostridia bacterium]|nr:alanine racemase [Clostridia bacterium]
MDSIYSSLRAWAEIDLDAVLANHRAMRSVLDDSVRCAAVIKADAYGHGARRIARLLEHEADYFAVAMTDEAEELRRDGIRKPILVLAHTPAGDLPRLARYNIETSVSTLEEAEEISRYAAFHKTSIGVHIALDTGMTRIGFPCTDSAIDDILQVSKLEGVRIRGVFSHFADADSADPTYTLLQTERFRNMTEKLARAGVVIPIRHLCNSAAAAQDGEKFDMVREGILLYGLAPSSETDLARFGKPRPAMSLRTHISNLRHVPAGTPVSYGCTFVTERDTVIATIQAGYADGVPRLLSGKGDVLVRGCRAPIAGRICMDQMMADVTDIEGVCVGDTVTVFGADGDEYISAEEVAANAGTIGYEIVCGISRRVPRVYIEGGEVTGVSRMLALNS